MAAESLFSGQEGIAGELGKLSLEMSSRSVANYVEQRPSGPPSVRWIAFLRAQKRHVWACDWFRVKTTTLKTVYVFVVLAHAHRGTLHACMQWNAKDVYRNANDRVLPTTPHRW
jgi:hypothetical protein